MTDKKYYQILKKYALEVILISIAIPFTIVGLLFITSVIGTRYFLYNVKLLSSSGGFYLIALAIITTFSVILYLLRLDRSKKEVQLSFHHTPSIEHELFPKTKKQREFIPIINITEQERKELEKIESEVDIETQEFICVVHKGPIAGNIYVCPRCKTIYCQKCVLALQKNKEKCWSCNQDFSI